jgi:hypothetical protein
MSSGSTPFFLTDEVAESAVLLVSKVIDNLVKIGKIKCSMCHIVILVPSGEVNSPSDYLNSHLLYEKSFGNTGKWPHEFAEIARSKAYQLWQERNDGRTDCIPHLLMPGDTPWWGGVRREGIVVACSGFHPHFDKMFAGMVADTCIALAYDAWSSVKGNFNNSGEDFLPELLR